MVYTHSTPDRAEKIIANPFYQTISSSFSGTQEYMAMEKLGQLTATGKWDLIVVDTPPSRSALDFLDAPQRMSSFLDGKMIRLLSAPARAGGPRTTPIGRRRLRAVHQGGRHHPGRQMLSDASALRAGFRHDVRRASGKRRRRPTTLLRSPGTAFVVVAAPEPDALREAAYFVDRLASENMPLAGLILNRTHPVLADLPAGRARTWRTWSDKAGTARLASAVLRLHATG